MIYITRKLQRRGCRRLQSLGIRMYQLKRHCLIFNYQWNRES
jgi:hypothetical protein